MKKSEMWLDAWRERYAYAIPTIIVFIYLLSYYWSGINLIESEYLVDALSGIITAVSILTGLLSALLGAVVQSKESSKGINFFFTNINKAKFVSVLKKSVFSGFASIFFSCLLFFSDIFGVTVSEIICIGWMWLLLYCLASTYRFANIFVALLVTDKEDLVVKEATGISQIDEQALKKRISQNKKPK